MTIQESIKEMAFAGTEMYCKICTVDRVDETARTVDCTPIDEGAPLLGVNLQANQEGDKGVTVFPAPGSYVVVAFLSPNAAVVVLTDEVDKVEIKIGDITVEITSGGMVLNGGSLGGMVNVDYLMGWMNKVAADMATISTGLSGVPYTFTPTTPTPVQDSLEDKKIKH